MIYICSCGSGDKLLLLDYSLYDTHGRSLGLSVASVLIGFPYLPCGTNGFSTFSKLVPYECTCFLRPHHPTAHGSLAQQPILALRLRYIIDSVGRISYVKKM